MISIAQSTNVYNQLRNFKKISHLFHLLFIRFYYGPFEESARYQNVMVIFHL